MGREKVNFSCFYYYFGKKIIIRVSKKMSLTFCAEQIEVGFRRRAQILLKSTVYVFFFAACSLGGQFVPMHLSNTSSSPKLYRLWVGNTHYHGNQL